MRRNPAALTIAAALLLAGCKTAPPERIVVPEIVKVPVREYVAVPEELTEPCPVAEVKSRTVEAVVEAANSRKTALDACNAKLREIRKLGGK